ncbi:ribonuclease HII [candidate division Kazan bacterium RIFCSPHIGHO2_01_FULL_49_10]|uniref:Ribonuclease HII n=1 Tax=candidate division Kazan bacterium RIFCSPLOWO2_01_FULL_48_13 TaxID=1798539 RepID=A0A1F4PP81_UNCK3|nr:MAG: ribonuclease HII [candidate division Kazan bacterium RIFCSPHIGHO2_01_FULL_49_10]OGB85439.1 MAG: ribonuclease HII [candidate division Kazan bacterium RIFCSPLOWO2_01_FULL_48_13]
MRRQRKVKPNFKFERELRSQGNLVVVGVDEAGRGAWAGPVVAAAVVLPFLNRSYGINDSKLLTPRQRESILLKVYRLATDIGIGIVENNELDEMGVGQATYLAMRRAVSNLSIRPDFILVDGFRVGFSGAPSMGIIDGDQKSLSIAAASIVAKVARDRMMDEIDQLTPGYGLSVNKGYGTAFHQIKLRELGVSCWHRQSFKPVKQTVSATANLQLSQ